MDRRDRRGDDGIGTPQVTYFAAVQHGLRPGTFRFRTTLSAWNHCPGRARRRNRMKPALRSYLIGTAALLFSALALAALPPLAGFGPNPQLPAPHEGLIPTVDIAPA